VFGTSMLLNTFLNYCLIFGHLGAPRLGITGAALATLASRVAEFAIVAVCALRDRRVPLCPMALVRPGRAIVKSAVRYAGPVILNETLWGTGTSIMTAVMGHMAISADMLAAYAIMGNIDKFSTVACFGLAGATAVVVGKRIGEGAPREQVYDLGVCLLTLSALVGLALSAGLAVLLPTVFIPYLYPLFSLTPQATEIAVLMCVIYLAVMPMRAFDITNITGLLRAGGDARMAAVLDLCPLWLAAIPLTALAALVLHAPVVWVCLATQAENYFKMPLGILRLRSRKWINDVTIRRGE
jgi:Na+-driven multidrug efflux pump